MTPPARKRQERQVGVAHVLSNQVPGLTRNVNSCAFSFVYDYKWQQLTGRFSCGFLTYRCVCLNSSLQMCTAGDVCFDRLDFKGIDRLTANV